MTCHYCEKHHWFREKIGRCRRCMNQLTVLSVLCWVVWWWFCRSDPKSIESITLIFAGIAFHSLLALHLWMHYVILPWRKGKVKA
ncbi:DUF3624 domain-containing protein [Vibrio japonicus]|uniref:DUF3624 domain-containing protein n=1 Tax=Vibrio japonicus TaxID=1824638 RepID=A0ABY5LJ38_9VIBR|nr:DUF3624 domain-containing protein [Vibrio japonicus]UUM30787.1 DUF3624 domain-containing protein [Vibrio japonicus]